VKKFNYKKVLGVFCWLLAVSGICISLAFVSRSTEMIRAEKLEVVIENDEENFFISEQDVSEFYADRRDPLLGNLYKDIDFPMLEKSLNAHPAVQNAEVASTLDGQVRVSVRQRTPVLRVINRNGESYYIDEEATLMPLDDDYTARVLVATGELNEPYARRSQMTIPQIASNKTYSELSYLDDLYSIARHVMSDSTLVLLVQQLNVNTEGDIEIFPAVGSHRVILGDATDLDIKFNKLKLFYTQGLNRTNSWSRYSMINLKYKNLVVCTKKQEYGKQN
jgi:cell division protein FtsQ